MRDGIDMPDPKFGDSGRVIVAGRRRTSATGRWTEDDDGRRGGTMSAATSDGEFMVDPTGADGDAGGGRHGGRRRGCGSGGS